MFFIKIIFNLKVFYCVSCTLLFILTKNRQVKILCSSYLRKIPEIIVNFTQFYVAHGEGDFSRAESDMVMIKHGRVIPPTGPLTLIHLSSVCFDSKAAT